MANHIHIHLHRTADAEGPAHAPAGSSKGGQFVAGSSQAIGHHAAAASSANVKAQPNSSGETESHPAKKAREAAGAVMSKWEASEKYPLPTEEQKKQVLDYVAAGKGVSMNTMFDKFEHFLSAGRVKSLVDAHKEVRASMASPAAPRTQAQRGAAYLSQKHIGLIKR